MSSDSQQDESPATFANKDRQKADDFLKNSALGSATYDKLDDRSAQDIKKWIGSDGQAYWEENLPLDTTSVAYVPAGANDNFGMDWNDDIDNFGGAEWGADEPIHHFHFLLEKDCSWGNADRKLVYQVVKDNFGVFQSFYRMRNIEGNNLRIELLCEAEECG